MSQNINRLRLETLRHELGALKIDGFLVPRADQYPGEFVSAFAERLAWLTGFTGSAGMAVILKDKAAIFTDGRYTIQLAREADSALYEFADIFKTKSAEWIAAHTRAGQVIGYDPWLFTVDQLEAMQKTLEPSAIILKPISENPVDKIRGAAAPAVLSKVEIFPDAVAGKTSQEKKKAVAEVLSQAGASAFIMAMPDSIAWLLNIRGDDVEHTPVVLSHGILYADGRFTWLADPKRVTPEVKKHIGPGTETLHPDFTVKTMKALAAAHKTIALDFARTPMWFKKMLEADGAALINLKDPCILPKAMKTPEEQAAIRAAHIKDGVAMVRFLAWLDETGGTQDLTELDIIETLENFRKKDPSYRGPSFSTIAGWGAHGAIVHYRANAETNQAIKPPGLLLLDSGGQYEWGTTDITRTVAIGEVAADMRDHVTVVLKGHIALARAYFTNATTGAQLDELARMPLRQAGLDYSHGTGHGVGCYLAVHEDAANISLRGKDPLQPGMLLSNEPGYYREGAYGIRIENLVLTVKSGDGLAFETVTMAPIDRRLINPDKLSAGERSWLNDYHARVKKTLSPLLEDDVRVWLEQATAPV